MYDEEMEIFLNEITLSKMNENRISKNNTLRVDQPTVFLVIPDTNINIWNVIYNSGIIQTNCESIICSNKMFKINNKMFSGKAHFLDLKKNLLVKKSPGKKFRINSTLPLDKISSSDKIFWFYDLSLYSQSLKYSLNKFSPMMAVQKFFNAVSKEYIKIKNKNPIVKVELLFFIKNLEGDLFNIFKNIKIYLPEKKLQDLTIYDNFAFISNCDKTILPIYYKDKGKNKLNLKNINKIEDLLEKEIIKKDFEKESIIEKDEEEIVDKETKEVEKLLKDESKHLNKLSSDLSKLKTNVKETDDNISIHIDNVKLSQVLKKHNINDPGIVSNVKVALDDYINKKGDKLTKDEAEVIVFKSIHSSIYGDDEIKPEFIKHPENLIKKLEESRTHKTPLIFPKSLDENIVDPKDIVDIKFTTGVWRQKQEFEESIHENVKKLFKTYENLSVHPIKVKDIKHTIIDDDMNRIIRYEVTLQNQDGGKKEPYKVYLNVPGIVNDRYLKLNDVPYIVPAQHFMKPVTKTIIDDVRILTNYAIIRLKLENVKFMPTELVEIINYIQIKYPGLIKSFNEDSGKIILNNGNELNIYKTEEPIFKSNTNTISIKDSQTLIDQDGNEIKQGKYEFLYDILIENVQKINPKDQLGKTTKSIPYISIYLAGLKVPFIIYLWQQKGLLTTLNDFGINYEISNKTKNNGYTINTSKGFLNISPKSRKEKFLCNGLLQLKINKTFDNIDDPTEIHSIIDNNYGQQATFNMRKMNENMIDVITQELLEFENLPTNLNNLLMTHGVDKLLNSKIDNIVDLKVYRARISEMFLNIMYSVIKMSHTEYSKKILLNDEDAKINIYSDFILDEIYNYPGVLTYTESTNPVDEIILASKTIKTGPNGIKNKNTFRKEHRNIHPSHIGNLSANGTSESGNVGLDTAHTLTTAIINSYGSYGKKEINGLSGWDTVSMNEALIPFINEIDSDRAVMATKHATQVTPTNGSEPPFIGTGAEFIVPQLSSKRFIQKANTDGIVTEVEPGKYITVKYNNGKTEIFDIFPRLSKTKMNAYISLDMNTLKIGDKFSKNQLVAWSKNFDKNGMYCSGTNTTMAIMQYMGRNHEDAYCVTENFTEKMTRDILREVSIVIPPDTKIINLEKQLNKHVTKDDVLVEFQYDYGLDNYLDSYDALDLEDDENDLVDNTIFKGGEKSIKTMGKEGEITDIKIFINNRNSVDKQLILFHKELVKNAKDTITKLESNYDNEDDKIKAIDNVSLKFTKIGGHKLKGGKEFTGGRIVYLIKQKVPLFKGDKLASRYAAKGVIADQIIPKEFTPKSKIHELDINAFISPTGVFSRKNVAMVKELYLGKVIYFLDKKIKEDSKNAKVDINKIIKLIRQIYELIGGEESGNYIDNYFKRTTPLKFRKLLKDSDSNNFRLFFPVKPFKKIKFSNIYEAANLLDIELDEHIYLPEFDMWTKEKVPVGIMYMQVLEQTSQIYASIRSAGKYQAGTGQATKGKN